MTNHELEIIMKLKDEVSKRLQGIEGNFHRFANGLKNVGQTMRSLGREISQVGSTMMLFGGMITGPFLLAFKNADKYSSSVHHQLEKLKNITDQFQVSLAQALVPIIEKFVNLLGGLLNAWNSLSPATQQMIVQGAFLTGVFITIGGSAGYLIGKLVALGGAIANVVGKFLTFALAHIPLMLVIGSLVILIGLMFKFKAVADIVMSTLEILWTSFIAGLDTIKLAFAKVLAFILGGLEKVYNLLAKLPGQLGAPYKEAVEKVKEMRQELDKMGDHSINNIVKNSEKMGKILTTGDGSWSKGFEDIKDNVDKVWGLLKNPPKVDFKPLQERFDYLKNITKDTFLAMERSFSDLFYNSLMQKSFKIADFFRQLGQNVLRIWTDMLAKMITRWIEAQIAMQSADAGSSGGGAMKWLKLLGGLAGAGAGVANLTSGLTANIAGMGKVPVAPQNYYLSNAARIMHGGGLVRAHNGLAIDEVPLIAKHGEYMLSERGVAAAGGVSNLNRINRGESLGNIILQPTVIIQAVDTQTGAEFILKNKGPIGQAIVEGILKNNVALRGALKKYGS